MASYISPELQARLLSRLAECPVDNSVLWSAYWGNDGGEPAIPANITRIAADLKQAEKSRTILVHGRYGTGKSSFIRCLESQIKAEAMTLWLNMPTLTSNIASSALAAVIIAISRELEKQSKDSNIDSCNLGQALEDLWRIEAGALRAECADDCDCTVPPAPSRMAGALYGDGVRYLAANTLEEQIEKCVKIIDEKSKKQNIIKKSLVVFLDDLDRCTRRVAMDVIRLLLRFGSTSNVHFVLACDWDVLEQGVKDWMAAHGKADHGKPIVTANSALEKYIHILVELPGMGKKAIKYNLAQKSIPEMLDMMKEYGTVIDAKDVDTGRVYQKVILADVFVGEWLAEIGAGEQS